MEIEAKFSLLDQEIIKLLQTTTQIAEFTLLPGTVKNVHDVYLDTPDRRFIKAGYALRMRHQNDDVIVTLKSLDKAEGAVHRREELETSIPAEASPEEWPESQVRDRVQNIRGSKQLEALFDLQQQRLVRLIKYNDDLIAELSLDDVSLTHGQHTHTYQELEIELKENGTEEDLNALVTYLKENYSMVAESKSKFERGLAFTQAASEEASLLTPREHQILNTISERDDMYGRRALALLALNEGMTQTLAGSKAHLSARRVRYWLAEFRKRNLEIFPEKLLPTQASTPPKSEAPSEAPQKDEITAKPTAEHPSLEPKPASEPKEPEPPAAPKTPGLIPDDSMAEAARKTLQFHFERMLKHESGTREGSDIEELHDMRVATRRMRAAFRVFDDYLDMKLMKPYVKGLRRTGRALGIVRDMDVFLEKTQAYLKSQPKEEQPDLAPLIQAWEIEHKQARAALIAYLDDKRYKEFKEQFGELLSKPLPETSHLTTDQEAIPHRLRHVVPIAIYERLAEVRAYEEWLEQPNAPLERYHNLRIAAKGLRYTLEYFQEILGAESEKAIREIKNLQNHLGDLQDAIVASERLRNFWVWGTWETPQKQRATNWMTAPIIAPGVAVYLAARQTEIQQLLSDFPTVWQRFQSSHFSELIASAVQVL